MKCLGTRFSATAEDTERVCNFLLISHAGKRLCTLGTSLSLLACGGGEEKGFMEGSLLRGWLLKGHNHFCSGWKCWEWWKVTAHRVSSSSFTLFPFPFSPFEPWVGLDGFCGEISTPPNFNRKFVFSFSLFSPSPFSLSFFSASSLSLPPCLPPPHYFPFFLKDVFVCILDIWIKRSKVLWSWKDHHRCGQIIKITELYDP